MAGILVVEDDPVIAGVLREALEGEGYAVTPAVDGEALWLAALERPAAILMDVNMPGMDGSRWRAGCGPTRARGPSRWRSCRRGRA